MSTAQDSTTQDASTASTVVRTRGGVSRALAWILIVLVLLGVAVVALQVAAQRPGLRTGFDPEGNGPGGTRALAEILRAQGVEVDVVRSRIEAARTMDGRSTLVLADPYALSDDAVRTLIGEADDVVMLTGSARMLRILGLGDYAAGSASGPLTASCDLPEFARVGEIEPGQLFRPADGVTACFADDSGAAVLVADEGDRRRAIVDGSRLLTNERLAENGNAALGLALLGQHERVVWYVPSFGDTDLEPGDAEATLAELTPGWVTPAILTLLLAAIVAGVWRGRRFGPLVAETLPVTVRASETMHGRARLTAHAADAGHAAQALRAGTIGRLAARLAMPAADPAAVADAAADRVQASRDSVRPLLTGPVPSTDPDLILFARRLAALETAVDDVVRIERSTP
ncbi:DUF4350 domain-containing protein [Microbacterium resistens]|uniref:DUF4350 domain-containing protein n=1 Tax=Microbacterium resistens TaxID=156977 RepID=UPI00366DC3AB